MMQDHVGHQLPQQNGFAVARSSVNPKDRDFTLAEPVLQMPPPKLERVPQGFKNSWPVPKAAFPQLSETESAPNHDALEVRRERIGRDIVRRD